MRKLILAFIIFTVVLTGCYSLKSGQAIVTVPLESEEAVTVGTDVEKELPSINIPDAVNDCSPLCKEDDLEDNVNSEELPDVNTAPDINNGIDTSKDGIGDDPSNPDNNPSQSDKILQSFSTVIPAELAVELKYTNYKVENDYLIVVSQGANVRERPDSSSPVIKAAKYLERIKLIAEVQGEMLEKYETDKWYKVSLAADPEPKYGYILSALAQTRHFQFEKMLAAASGLKKEIETYTSGHIANYKDRNGKAPEYKGESKDSYGTVRYQSAPAYLQASVSSDFRYITDGTLVSILAETDSFYKIRTLNFEGEYYIPKKYVSFGQALKELTKVVVVDRQNQNEGVFEFIDGEWKLVSYIYATTGETANYKQPTELGYFMAIQKKDKFRYLDDVTKTIAGYAPYAIRFNGGAYIHGVPIEYKVQDGVLTDPGKQEFLYSIGTIPRSHKCVRNYTSHALFLYNWTEIGKSAVIVVE